MSSDGLNTTYLAFIMALKVSGHHQWCGERLDEVPPLGHRMGGEVAGRGGVKMEN